MIEWGVHVISRKRLREFWQQVGKEDAEQPLKAWLQEAERADWRTPAEVKAAYGSASILKSGRVVFNVGGNKYRLVVAIRYDRQVAYIRFVGTHVEYDRIDAEGV